MRPWYAQRGVDLVEQAAADDEHLARRRHLGEELREIALERLVVERPRELARTRVVREVVALIEHHSASAMIRYS